MTVGERLACWFHTWVRIPLNLAIDFAENLEVTARGHNEAVRDSLEAI